MIRAGLLLYDLLSLRRQPAALARRRRGATTRFARPLKERRPARSPIGTPGSTMPGWSSSTRSTRPSAAPRSPPAPNCSPPAATARSGRAELSGGRAVAARSDRQRRRPLGRRGARASGSARDQREPGPAGQGQPHRRAAPLARATMPISSSSPTAASSSPFPYGDLTLIGTTDMPVDRPEDAVDHGRRRSRYLCAAAEPLFHAADRAGRRRLELFGRPRALRRRRRRRQGRHPRLSSRARRATRARNCSRCSAARSPPPARWPRRRSTCSASTAVEFTATHDASRRRHQPRLQRLARPSSRAWMPQPAARAASPAPTAPGCSDLLGDAVEPRRSRPPFRRRPLRARGALSDRRANSPAPPRTSSGAGPSSAWR